MREGIKISMLINGYYPRIGGAERQLGFIAPRLQVKGFKVIILTRKFPGLSSYEEIDGIPVHRLPVPGFKAIASLSYTISALFLLGKIKPDILHSHELFSTTTTSVAAKLIFHRPVVVTLHSSGFFGDVTRLKKKFLGNQRLKIFRQYVDRFITISHLVGNELIQTGINPEKLVHIPNSVDTDYFKPLPPNDETRHQIRSNLGLSSDAVLIIYTGRLSEEKRPINLIKAWPVIHKRFPNSFLIILGSGQQENTIRKQLSEGIFMLGEVNDVLPYLQSSDIFVLPSAAEGLSVSLLEAMACGLPSVATDVGGTPEVLVDKKRGLLVPSDDIQALQNAIIDLLQQPDIRTEMGKESREFVINNFSLEMAVDRLSKLYEKLSGEENN